MAFPLVAATISSKHDTAVTTHNISIPAASAGQLFFAFINFDGAPTINTHPAGWDIAADEATTATKNVLYSKVSNGTETSPITVETASSEESGSWAWRISGQHTSTPYAVTVAEAGGVGDPSPDPPAISPAWGSADTLWIATYGASGNDSEADAYPTGFTENQFTQRYADGGAGEGGYAVCALSQAASSQDPSPFSMTTPNNRLWVAFTVAVQPAGAVAAVGQYVTNVLGRGNAW